MRDVETDPGFFTDFLEFLSRNRNWWRIPLIVIVSVILIGILLILAGQNTAIAPFIYAFF